MGDAAGGSGKARQCPKLGQRRCRACGKWIEQDEGRYECVRCGLSPICVEPCGRYHAKHGATPVEVGGQDHLDEKGPVLRMRNEGKGVNEPEVPADHIADGKVIQVRINTLDGELWWEGAIPRYGRRHPMEEVLDITGKDVEVWLEAKRNWSR